AATGATFNLTLAQASVVTLRSSTLAQPVNLDNTAGDPAGELRLSQAELNTITASAVRVGRGDDTAPRDAKSATTNPAACNTLHLFAGGSIVQSGVGAFVVPNLAAQAGGGVALTTVPSTVTTLAGSAGGIFRFGTTGSLGVGTVDGVAGITDTSAFADVTVT